MNDVIINFTDGNLNPQQAGQDHITGLLLYCDTLPSEFDTYDRVKAVYSITGAESLGITSDSATDEIKVLHYHISEFFRLNPGAKLWVGVYDVPDTLDFTELATMQRATGGECRRIGVMSCNLDEFNEAQVTAIQTICNDLHSEHRPTFVFLEAKPAVGWNNTNWPDLDELTARNVGVIIGADGAGKGATLATDIGLTVGIIGAVLGLSSKALAHESIAWVAKFNLVTGTELDVPALTTGELIKNLEEGALNNLQTGRYIFMRKHVGLAGTYLNDSLNANLATSDYNAIERIMVANKAARLLRQAYLPTLSGPILLEGGKIQKDVVASLNSIGNRALDEMLRTGEISERQVFVDPDQDITNTSKLVVSAKVVPVGVARRIEVNFSFNVTV